MTIFLSWSGKRSHEVAMVFAKYLNLMIQQVETWISSKDIESGSLWDSEIQKKLEASYIGIVFLTLENKDKPWIHYESGALSKGIPSNRVMTFLVDLQSDDLLKTPLSKFNHTLNSTESLIKLFITINKNSDSPLSDTVMSNLMDIYLTKLTGEIDAAINATPTTQIKKESNPTELISEVLDTVRSMDSRLRETMMMMVQDSRINTDLTRIQSFGRKTRVYEKGRPSVLGTQELADYFLDFYKEKFNEFPTEKQVSDFISHWKTVDNDDIS